jgi:hypothetical protein
MSRSFESSPRKNRRESKPFLWRARNLQKCNYGARNGFVTQLICSVQKAKPRPEHVVRRPIGPVTKIGTGKPRMKDFSNVSFSPDVIKAMDEALKAAVATLPHPVSSTRVQTIAESILRGAQEGERDPRTLQTMAMVEMQIRTEDKMN